MSKKTLSFLRYTAISLLTTLFFFISFNYTLTPKHNVEAQQCLGVTVLNSGITDININNRGNRWFECPPGQVITGVWYFNGSDDSIERIRCKTVTLAP